MPNIKPLRNYLLVKRKKASSTRGGILLPDSVQEKPREGVVISKGEGKRTALGALEEIDVEVGDTVLFSSYAGTEVKKMDQKEEEYLLLASDEILGVMIKE